MNRKFIQVKINIPSTNKGVIAYCSKLSAQRKLSTRVIRLLSDDLNKGKKDG